MPWPDIFFKSRKPKPDPSLQSTVNNLRPAAPPEIQPPTVKPIPTVSTSATTAIPRPQVKIASPETGTRTLPAMHGVILRPPSRLNTTTQITPLGGTQLPEPIKNVEQLMAEADPVRTLSQSGSVRLLKRQAPETTALPPVPLPPPPATPPTEPSAIKPDPALPGTSASTTTAPVPSSSAPTTPLPAIASERKPLLIPAPSPFSTTRSLRGPRTGDTPFILKPTVSLSSNLTRKIGGANPPAMIPLAVIRRKTNMSDVARLILPPKREENEPPQTTPIPVPTIVPPSFSVASEPPRPVAEDAPAITQPVAGSISLPASALENPFLEKSESKPVVANTPAFVETQNESTTVSEKPPETTSLFPDPPKVDPQAHTPEPIHDSPPKLDPEAHKESSFVGPPPENFTAGPIVETPASLPPSAPEILPETMSLFPDPPKVDSEAHKSEPIFPPVPQVDSQAHPEPAYHAPPEVEKSPEPATAVSDPPPATSTEITPAPAAKEKREFHLTNGEKVAGVVLSESPEAVYIEHGTLGVVTIPRNQIAKRLVEIILINGDRIVGDIMAETAEMLYVRHASLGMLSVPRAQRSTRVVEAILNDGDRILGEVLTETDTYTVIKSATLGTVTLPHNKVTMLNRKIEQIELKALPLSTPLPELTDKS